MKNVYLVSKPEGSTEIQLLDMEQAEARLPKELGVRLSSLFMFDRLVFVEGPTDEAILREWANTLNLNLSQANVGFISMGECAILHIMPPKPYLLFLQNAK
jgi:predicted ATP-dependent endonuclease of OLD family